MTAPLRQGELIVERKFGPFAEDAVARYAAASGDDNPLHVDPTVAARAGLAGPPIHGMLIMGNLQAFLEGWRPGARIAKLSAMFIKPVLVGSGFTLAGKVVKAPAEGHVVLRLTAKDDAGAIVCLAEAFVEP